RVFVETRDASGNAKPAPDMTPPPPKQVDTSITPETMKRIGDAFVSLPPGFEVHPRLKPQLDRRGAMAIEGNIDWAFGELLAFGATVLDGVPVRLAGQDSRRGTFSQRHSVLIDRNTGDEHTPLKYLDEHQAQFWVYDSLLSEFAAVGFEYGYSVANPQALVCWEAQFGDFVDGAQTIIDEFISSGEAKWGQRSRVALLLPHGFEGQGPDHSSARIERFLQLCAEDNITVANCTTPANYFHLLRRQALAAVRPLVVFTPKSLLRLRGATSAVEDFTTGGFRPVLADPAAPAASEVTKVLVCSGKVYYDLAAHRDKNKITDTAILRLEQLHPFPADSLREALGAYPSAEVRWVQEEPENMGGWTYVAFRLPALLGGRPPLTLRSRPPSASPAVGSSKGHEEQQHRVVESAFAD
ncbi:MAG TPA: multifunctional oxoglutarate decarboxylase/oxoglutarate dehydrogenase thiamine pyrophosphate-binding subunit/dihydrolipoyllysine-residue succinyltransferase subunit, partial [Mycobacteriales bacterium]|nr:multifunctional oxoglutarate decarboxylase/oxoglutarate dehydrogenase thiamine pyrophosphate-binding subunit/dihydrolipoyllysine-residue succinyltransferase subunit [Mycobacteriales bacterium]